MAGFFAELKRRQMFRVAAAYAVVAWLLLQVVNNVAPVLDLPVWVARAFLLALVIGFPIALLFVWMRDLAPGDATAPKPATTKLDYVLVGGLILVIALVSYQQLASAPPEQLVQGSESLPSSAGNITIAVLPFENLSGDPAQKFFSDGMREEITAALAKIPNLLLVGRQSLIEDDQKRDFAVLKQALGVSYVIGGSVRRDGDRVRITTQLVQTDNGVSVWTESYDRQLTTIFATQEDIARAIAGALRVPLGLGQGESLVANRTTDLDSYQQYLRARALVRARGGRNIADAISILEQLVAREPTYAPAWALLASAYWLAPTPGSLLGTEEARRIDQEALSKSEKAAREAIRLDPEYAGGYAQLGRIERLRGNWLAWHDLHRRALMLDPNDPEILETWSGGLARIGRLKESLRVREQMLALEPFVPVFKVTTADFLWIDGQAEAAIRMLETVPPENRYWILAGRALSATHLIDGSVRKAGDRVRITAQLVRADNGTQLWSETYDRDLTDIFAIQEEIARSITASLSVPLGLAQGDSLVRDRTRDLASYDQYLRAKVLVRARGPIEPGGPLSEAATLLEQVVARDPAFAPAWGLLAQAHALMPNFVPAASRSLDDEIRFYQASNAKAEMAAREAIRLDSRSAIAYSTLARVRARAGEFAAADDLYRQALALDPAEPEVLTSFSVTLGVVGRLGEALSVREKVRTLEPFVPNYNAVTAYYMLANGQTQAAIALMETLPADAAIFLRYALAQGYAAEGRYAEAADAILALPQPTPESRQIVQDAARLLRTAPAKVTAPRDLPDLDWLGFVYAYVGAEDRLMDYFERAQAAGAGPNNNIWQPAYAAARKTERFRAWARKAGLVDYWRTRGWPDLCRPVGADDFECD
jgi:TolB-like protein/predicted Zn-dependent protease